MSVAFTEATLGSQPSVHASPRHFSTHSPTFKAQESRAYFYSITAAWFALSAWEQTPGFNRLGPATWSQGRAMRIRECCMPWMDLRVDMKPVVLKCTCKTELEQELWQWQSSAATAWCSWEGTGVFHMCSFQRALHDLPPQHPRMV